MVKPRKATVTTDQTWASKITLATESANQLFAETDALTQRLVTLEALLVELNLATKVEVGLTASETLRFGKYGGRWGLFVKDAPLKACSREIRMLAVAQVPALLDALVQQVVVEAERMRAAREEIDGYLETLSERAAHRKANL